MCVSSGKQQNSGESALVHMEDNHIPSPLLLSCETKLLECFYENDREQRPSPSEEVGTSPMATHLRQGLVMSESGGGPEAAFSVG